MHDACFVRGSFTTVTSLRRILMCLFLCRPAQETAQAWKERISIRDLDEQARTTTTVTDELTLASWLCYACHTTLTSRSARASTRAAADGTARHPVPLPSWTVNHLRRGRPSEGHHDATELVESDRTTSQRQEVWTTRPMSERDMLTKVNDFILDE